MDLKRLYENVSNELQYQLDLHEQIRSTHETQISDLEKQIAMLKRQIENSNTKPNPNQNSKTNPIWLVPPKKFMQLQSFPHPETREIQVHNVEIIQTSMKRKLSESNNLQPVFDQVQSLNFVKRQFLVEYSQQFPPHLRRFPWKDQNSRRNFFNLITQVAAEKGAKIPGSVEYANWRRAFNKSGRSFTSDNLVGIFIEWLRQVDGYNVPYERCSDTVKLKVTGTTKDDEDLKKKFVDCFFFSIH